MATIGLLRKLLPAYRPSLGSYAVTSTATAATEMNNVRSICNESTSMSSEKDYIQILGMRFHGHHGVLPEETRLGQTFVVDAKMHVETWKAGVSDALEDTVNYASVYRDIKGVVEGPPCKLLEAVAHRACDRVLRGHPAVKDIRLSVRKLSIPGLPSIVESVGVEVHRQR